MTARRVRVEGDLFHGRVPEDAVYVGRAAPGLLRSRYANPWKVGSHITDQDTNRTRVLTAEAAVDAYRQALLSWRMGMHSPTPFTVDDVRRDLAGRDLACWCKTSEPCHADVLLELANS